jgi:hypothetical protein
MPGSNTCRTDLNKRFNVRSKAVAFGDFLSERPQIQAGDVGVMLTRRTPISGNDDNDEEEQAFLKQLKAKNRFVHVQRFQPRMSEHTHGRSFSCARQGAG